MPRDRNKWELECFLDVVAAVGAPTDDRRLEFPIRPEATERALQVLRQRGIAEHQPFIALCPGSSKNWPQKQWAPERFAAVADWAARERGLPSVLVGAGFERELCDHVTGLAQTQPVNLAGDTSVQGTAAVLAAARAMVTNDTGPLHLACAVGTPVVAVFGPTNERKWGPRGPHDVVITSDACDCRPCYYLSYMPDCPHRNCLQQIPVDAVLAALAQILDLPSDAA